MFLPYLAALVKDCLAQVRDADQFWPASTARTLIQDLRGDWICNRLGKPILGYRTDFRGSEIEGVNAMVRYGCTDYILAHSIEKSTEELAAILATRLSSAMK